jgi:YidC/Oxa1 family membrane protein insertase
LAEIFNTILFYPFLNLLLAIYHIFGNNFGWAIIIVAVVTRLAMMPLMKTQIDMTKKMASLQPELAKLQKQYANNQEKLSEEQMKLYKKVGYNPLGCIGTLIPQLVILSALYGVIRAVSNSNFDGIYPFIQTWVFGSAKPAIDTTFLWWDLRIGYNAVAGETSRFSAKALPYLILALFVGLSQYLATDFSQRLQKHGISTPKRKKNEPMSQQEMQEKTNTYMMAIFPVMTIFLAFSYSSALSIYWMVQSFALVIQYLLMDVEKSKSFLKEGFLGKIFNKKLSKTK